MKKQLDLLMAAVWVSGLEAFFSKATESLSSGGPPASPTAGFYTARYLAGQSLCPQTKRGDINKSELVHLKWEDSPGIQSTQWHLDLEEAQAGKKTRYFYNWIMDTTQL